MNLAATLPWSLVALALAGEPAPAGRSPEPVAPLQEGSSHAGGTPAEEQIAWLRAHALPLATAEAGHGFEDLQPLKEIIGGARIVALGEGTHGTREFFQMKHRLVEFLASEMGFTIFSIEASTPEAYELDAYVLGAPGDPRALIGGMHFWTWNTEEVLAMVEWMRAFNASKKGTIHFTGFDMQTPDVAMENVAEFLGSVDPERAEDVRALYAEIKGAHPSGGFAVATGSFPVELARGKRVRFSGWIRTEDVQDGWAGLWWRNDLAGGARGGFENMQDRGPRGTQPWAEFSLELEVPADTSNINFGLLMPGKGKAWFDDLAIELDGQPFEDERFDLGFERGIRGFSAHSPGYGIRVDDAEKHAGARSLCMASIARGPSTMDTSEAAAAAREVLDELLAGREALVRERGAKEVEWAIHNARIVEQCMRSRAEDGFLVRDRSMAENVEWILEQDPSARIVLWAHNGHLRRKSHFMGAHLASKFGRDYLPIGFATHAGRYTAVGEAGLADHELRPSVPDSVEAVFAATGAPRLFLDLRLSEAGSGDSGWLREERPFRSIGALAQEEQFFPTVIAEGFDVLIYLRSTSAAVQLGTRPARR